tara:strand:- start:109 stop:483 length:375 start_codon:yes stop_codon:yes gene_type:complete
MKKTLKKGFLISLVLMILYLLLYLNVDSIKPDDSIERMEKIERLKEINDKKSQLIEKIEGTYYKYPESLDFIEKYGNPQTLDGTNNEKWIAYWPKGDFTTHMTKATDKFYYVCIGNCPGLHLLP